MTPSAHSPALSATLDLSEALRALETKREALPWPQRRGLVARIAGPLTEGLAGEPFRSLLLLLAEDPKWEVRRDVAEALGAIPDLELSLLAERFLEDSHAYVRRSAEQSIQRRTQRIRASQKRKRGLDLVEALEQELQDAHGKAAAQKARRMAEHLYDVLVGATVHEMRSVLTTLKHANATLVDHQAKGTLSAELVQEKGQLMGERILFMERLLLDMRNYTQPVPEARETVSVADLITEARSIVSENLRARNISPKHVGLDIMVAPKIEVKVARHHVVLALVNVLKNAYEALPASPDGPHGNISMSVRREDRALEIAIADSGEGIPEANLAEVRQCLPGRTSKKNYGTGFGLCCARRTLEAHGGRLEISSQVHVGTTVKLLLPA